MLHNLTRLVTVRFALVAVLSIQPVLNMLSPGQVMNTSFDPFDLVNTYGGPAGFGTQAIAAGDDNQEDITIPADFIDATPNGSIVTLNLIF